MPATVVRSEATEELSFVDKVGSLHTLGHSSASLSAGRVRGQIRPSAARMSSVTSARRVFGRVSFSTDSWRKIAPQPHKEGSQQNTMTQRTNSVATVMRNQPYAAV